MIRRKTGPARCTFKINLPWAPFLSSTVKFDLANNTTPASNDLLEVAGDLSIPGPSKFSFNLLDNQLESDTTYKLIHYTGTEIGSVASITPDLPSGTTRQSFSLRDSTLHYIELVVVGTPANLTWKGNLGSNAWNLNPL